MLLRSDEISCISCDGKLVLLAEGRLRFLSLRTVAAGRSVHVQVPGSPEKLEEQLHIPVLPLRPSSGLNWFLSQRDSCKFQVMLSVLLLLFPLEQRVK